MFFTRDTLEQATHREVARHRAERAIESGMHSVLDLTCGLGADLVAFSRAGLDVSAVDRDPLTAAIAAANLRALHLDGHVEVGTAERQDLAAVDLVYVDPARRAARGRVFDPAAYSPPWSFVESLFDRDAVVKAAPGLAHSLVPESRRGGVDQPRRTAARGRPVVWPGRLGPATGDRPEQSTPGGQRHRRRRSGSRRAYARRAGSSTSRMTP